jgi:hypothetical protein
MDRRHQGQQQNSNGSRHASGRGNNGGQNHNSQRAPRGPFNQYGRVIGPVLQAVRNDACEIRSRGQATEVLMPVSKGWGMQVASVLVVHHPEGDVSILEAVTPTTMAMGAASGVAVELRNNLRRGEHYERVSVYKLHVGVAFQRWGFREMNERVGTVTPYFPDIRRASPANLEKLAVFTGMDWRVNAQVRWNAYRKIDDTRFARHNYAAGELSAFNAMDMEQMKQTMEQFADVAWGTELSVARQLVAAMAASEGAKNVDTSSPLLGFADDVDVEMVDPSRLQQAREMVNVVEVAPVALQQVELEVASC